MTISIPRLSLVLGGARSGKSLYAESLVATTTPPWRYIATAEAWDEEMTQRIHEHQERRDTRWHTTNAPLQLAEAITAHPGPTLVDCLTLWLTNIMLGEKPLQAELDRLLAALNLAAGPIVVVSNEVGFGIVPDNKLARDFRDAQGRLNQQVAAIADDVVLVAAGLPLHLKRTAT